MKRGQTMKILLTGANGYIGKRLLPLLIENGHHVVCAVRDPKRFAPPESLRDSIDIITVDWLDEPVLDLLPADIDTAYYLIHSMSSSLKNFESLEIRAAEHFSRMMAQTHARQIIYLSGISNEKNLSRHLKSRRQVEHVLQTGPIPVTVLRAGIIVGSGSASFEIIRDLVEKLPVMIAPRWLLTETQPIAIGDVLRFLLGVLHDDETVGATVDIGGPDVLTYKDMLLQYAGVRQLKRHIFIVPVMTPRLSSYWLYFVTNTSYKLAVNLVDSMKIRVVCRPNDLADRLGIQPLSYRDAVKRALAVIQQQTVPSSWIDSYITSSAEAKIAPHVEVPEFGVFRDEQRVPLGSSVEQVWERVWSIGGKNGWTCCNFLWKLRGVLDLLSGGIGLRRGRRDQYDLRPGDALDFWRVLVADPKNRQLLLFAEMKLPGEAWLYFHIHQPQNAKPELEQTATFRPIGLWGRIYWVMVKPFHLFIFRGMARRLAK
jgi:uncharacterized protein YbjT (DUF2867 family)